jgi:hypothetical protein
MIKVICIADSETLKELALDTWVETNGEYLVEETMYSYRVQLKGILSNYFVDAHKRHFITMAEWREQQINSILDGY